MTGGRAQLPLRSTIITGVALAALYSLYALALYAVRPAIPARLVALP
jgi:hypothetical protein